MRGALGAAACVAATLRLFWTAGDGIGRHGLAPAAATPGALSRYALSPSVGSALRAACSSAASVVFLIQRI